MIEHLATTDRTDAPEPTTPADPTDQPDPALGPVVLRALRRRSFAGLATSSPEGRAHAAGILYQLADGHLWFSTMRSSRKARNMAANQRVAVTVPVRRLPFGPPATVQAQGTAELVDLDDPELRRLAAAGALKRITSHGELELPGSCFVRISLARRVPVYALGMPLLQVLRDPLNAGRLAEVTWS